MTFTTQNIFFTAVVFLTTLAGGQIVAWKYSRAALLWLVVDYVWLVIAGLTILNAVKFVRDTELQWRLPEAKARLENTKEMCRTHFGWNVRHHSERSDVASGGRGASEQEAAKKWYEGAVAMLVRPDASLAQLKNDVERLAQTRPSLVNQSEAGMLLSFVQHKAEVEELERQAKPGDWRVFAPALLAIGLGLRFAKTTADFLGRRKKPYQPAVQAVSA